MTVAAQPPPADAVPDAAAAPAPAKKAVKALPKPDGAAHKAALAALEATIEAKKARVAEIKALLDARAEDRKGGGSPEVAAARTALNELRESFKAELVSVVRWGARARGGGGDERFDFGGRGPRLGAPAHASPRPAPRCTMMDWHGAGAGIREGGHIPEEGTRPLHGPHSATHALGFIPPACPLARPACPPPSPTPLAPVPLSHSLYF